MRLGRKGVLHICAALLCGGLLGSGPALAQTAAERVIEDAVWGAVGHCTSVEEVKGYLEMYPKGRYAAEARACLERAAQRAAQRAVEEAFWDSIKGCTSAGEMGAYLAEFPKGRHVAEARTCLARLQGGSGSPGTEFQDCSECPEMVVVPAGSFMMGSPPDEEGRYDDEGPQHRVTIGDAFAVGKYEVTFAEWDACVAAGGCSTRPSDGGRGRGRRPVIGVSWHDAQEYVRWLSGHTGKRYRLLSEAEWEYAARAGTVTRFHWGYAVGWNRANCLGCGDSKSTAPVGSFAPNGFGLHDIHGNVREWVEDCWHGDYNGAPSDGSAWTTFGDCSKRVARGGSWLTRPEAARSAVRFWNVQSSYTNRVGFRVALALSP